MREGRRLAAIAIAISPASNRTNVGGSGIVAVMMKSSAMVTSGPDPVYPKI